MTAYFAALGDAESILWPEREDRDAAVHFASEILMRTLGPLRAGAPYEELPSGHPGVREAVDVALRSGSASSFRDLLGSG